MVLENLTFPTLFRVILSIINSSIASPALILLILIKVLSYLQFSLKAPFRVQSPAKIAVASEFGPRALALLEQNGIRKVVVRAGTIVSNVIRDKLYKKG
jgi:hypothetical protein